MAPDAVSDELQALIGQALQRCRLAADLTREEFAQRLGLSATRIDEYERGTTELEAAVLWRVTQAIGVSIDEFYAELRVLLGEPEPERGPARAAADPQAGCQPAP